MKKLGEEGNTNTEAVIKLKCSKDQEVILCYSYALIHIRCLQIHTGSSVQFEFAPTGDDVAISILIAVFIFFGGVPRCCLPFR